MTLKVENVPDYISKSKYEDLFRPFGSMKCIKLEDKSVLVTFTPFYSRTRFSTFQRYKTTGCVV